MRNIRVMHFDLGPIGTAVVRQIAARPGLHAMRDVALPSFFPGK